MRIKTLVIVAVLAAVAMTAAAAAQGENTFRNRFEEPAILFNPCVPEDIPGVIRVHEVEYTTQTGSGNLQRYFHTNLIFHGVGAVTRAKYSINHASDQHIKSSANGASNETFTLHFSVIAQGSVPDIPFRFVIHVTVNANGEVTSTTVKFAPDRPTA
jgi:hypothetical protein